MNEGLAAKRSGWDALLPPLPRGTVVWRVNSPYMADYYSVL